MKKLSKILCALCVIFGSVSCADMMDIDSELVEFEKDHNLDSPSDTVYSVLGIIHKMQVIADRTVLLGEVRGDLVSVTDAASSDLKRLASFQLSEDNKYNVPADYYAVINNCNYFIANADTLLSRRGKKVFEKEFAAVKTFRAWTYMQLVMAYGSVPLLLEPIMTEAEADKALKQPRLSVDGICDYFISDLAPYVDVKFPEYGAIGGHDSKNFFIPVRLLLGDMCLWTGRYQEAARFYHDYLAHKDAPHVPSFIASSWPDAEFKSPNRAFSHSYLSYIPMEINRYSGIVSELGPIFNSDIENYYYFQLEPSKSLRALSAAQTYCFVNKTGTTADTIYAPKKGLLSDIYAGDLRLCTYYTYNRLNTDEYSEFSSDYQKIFKFSAESRITTYRLSIAYLRYAEALNRAGYPQSAFAVLKYGLNPDNIGEHVDSVEIKAAGSLISFDPLVFTEELTMGVHSIGSGESAANAHYTLPMPSESLASYADTVAYQIPLVEDMIINEMALEGSFEGNRYYDLMRVALRRNDPGYLAAPVSERNGVRDDALYTLLMDTKNWYLPLK
ncbi:RagB/SusD family nutrient uptake outer membrane protein [Xylanibacter muris]|nr:RagB/SusD family nutrient uptake outer membrane protein [Xylanibacter muris]